MGKTKQCFFWPWNFSWRMLYLKTSLWGAPLPPTKSVFLSSKLSSRKTSCVLVPHWRKKLKKLKPQKNGIFEFFCFFYWKIVKRIIASSSWEPKFCFHEEGQLFSLFGYQTILTWKNEKNRIFSWSNMTKKINKNYLEGLKITRKPFWIIFGRFWTKIRFTVVVNKKVHPPAHLEGDPFHTKPILSLILCLWLWV